MNIDKIKNKKYRLKNFYYIFSIITFIALFVFCTRSYIPNEISVFNNEQKTINLPSTIFSVTDTDEAITVSTNTDKKTILENTSSNDSKVTVNFLGIPIKKTNVNVLSSKTLIPSGKSVGINIKTNGVMVLGTGAIIDDEGQSVKPWENKLMSKDIILEANGSKVHSKEDLSNIINQSNKIDFLIERDNEQMHVEIIPVQSLTDNTNKIGVWVRDGTEGIGTLTYINTTTNKFGALGHGVLDVDTNQLMPVSNGKILESQITTINKGEKGSPGELIGHISNTELGEVSVNTSHGIYGTWTSTEPQGEEMEIALKDEIQLGTAYILCDIGNNGVQQYKITIEDINLNSKDEKGMVIRITDENLLKSTNGIIQGMSGSPIIQNNKIIGAVTHVFVQDPAKGYGIFIENMLNQEKEMTTLQNQ